MVLSHVFWAAGTATIALIRWSVTVIKADVASLIMPGVTLSKGMGWLLCTSSGLVCMASCAEAAKGIRVNNMPSFFRIFINGQFLKMISEDNGIYL